MLTEINQCRNFLDVKKILKLLSILKEKPYSIRELKNYFYEDAILLKNLEDTVFLLNQTKLIAIDSGSCKLNKSDCKVNEEFILENILNEIVEQEIVLLSNIDNNCFLTIDYNLYALRNFLLSENVISNYPITNLYLLHSDFTSKIEKFSKSKISKEQLLENIQRQNEYGEMAELFVIDFERRSLDGKSPIVHVALEDAGAGYDVKSYLNKNSLTHNKFIEVKCFSSQGKKFYISRNEILTSQNLGDNYFLYLVDSSFKKPPYIIRNPYRLIFNNPEINKVAELFEYDIKEIEDFLKK